MRSVFPDDCPRTHAQEGFPSWLLQKPSWGRFCAVTAPEPAFEAVFRGYCHRTCVRGGVRWCLSGGSVSRLWRGRFRWQGKTLFLGAIDAGRQRMFDMLQGVSRRHPRPKAAVPSYTTPNTAAAGPSGMTALHTNDGVWERGGRRDRGGEQLPSNCIGRKSLLRCRSSCNMVPMATHVILGATGLHELATVVLTDGTRTYDSITCNTRVCAVVCCPSPVAWTFSSGRGFTKTM